MKTRVFKNIKLIIIEKKIRKMESKKSSEVVNKSGFIVDWYKKERIRFSFTKQIKLAKTWIGICTKNEEYEMAAALKKEMLLVVEDYIAKKRKSRTLKDKIRYFFLKLKRKIRRG